MFFCNTASVIWKVIFALIIRVPLTFAGPIDCSLVSLMASLPLAAGSWEGERRRVRGVSARVGATRI